jgi:hypothetical protein
MEEKWAMTGTLHHIPRRYLFVVAIVVYLEFFVV